MPAETLIEVRAKLLDLVLAYLQLGHEIFLGSPNFGANLDLLVVAMCVFTSCMSNKLATASSVARHTGVPRPTVIRKLGRLEDLGLVKRNPRGRVFMTEKALELGRRGALPLKLKERIVELAELVSKMDTQQRMLASAASVQNGH
jgi:DNA-binding transcriptional ArsR family regulator